MYSNNLICDILIYLNNNINSKILVEDLEKNFYYNRYYIMKLFKKEINLTIVEYINSIRVYNSILCLKNSNYSLLNISIKNGFYSLEYFSEAFKQITKTTPSNFKYFFKNKRQISEATMNLINLSIIRLYEINNIKDKYISRRKPNISPVKKLSIFK